MNGVLYFLSLLFHFLNENKASFNTLAGTIAGAFIVHVLEKRRSINTVLFEARRKTYAEVLGAAHNLVETCEYSAFTNTIKLLSEALLLAEPELRSSLVELSNKATAFYKKYAPLLGSVDLDPTQGQNELRLLIKETEGLMKKELAIK